MVVSRSYNVDHLAALWQTMASALFDALVAPTTRQTMLARMVPSETLGAPAATPSHQILAPLVTVLVVPSSQIMAAHLQTTQLAQALLQMVAAWWATFLRQGLLFELTNALFGSIAHGPTKTHVRTYAHVTSQNRRLRGNNDNTTKENSDNQTQTKVTTKARRKLSVDTLLLSLWNNQQSMKIPPFYRSTRAAKCSKNSRCNILRRPPLCPIGPSDKP